MYAKRLKADGTIGIFCPSHVADMERYALIADSIRRLGFGVKFGSNMGKDTYGYAASSRERADDMNELVTDDSVGMILFGGGETAVEILPYIDYGAIRRNPKLVSSYSDGTSILNAIYSQTGLVTYYGIGAGEFSDLRYYSYLQFRSHFVEGCVAGKFITDCKPRTIRGGKCEGTLTGGFSQLFGLMLSNRYFSFDSSKKHLLFLEDYEKFNNVGAAATYLSFIGQSGFMRSVTGLIFGHYSLNVPQDLLSCLERFGEEHGIPVLYTDDFGHGTRHAILPIGANAVLDADAQTLAFTSGV